VSIELLPLGKKCNIACSYCYQQDERSAAGNKSAPYDMEAMKAALLAEGVGNGTGWTLFGGEPLLMPIADIEALFAWSESVGAPVGVQTNGSLITQRHIDLFRQYSVSVGFSMDGPAELNDARQAMRADATPVVTGLSDGWLRRLLEEGVSVSLIVTLSSVNAGSGEKLERLTSWLLELRDRGLRYVNLHTLEPHGANLSLAPERQIWALRQLRRDLVGFARVSPFADMRQSLLQEQGAHCTFAFCDPYTTPAVRGIDGQGVRGNCGRTNAGRPYVKSDTPGHERYLALYLTPMKQGGCGGCRFFLACGGGNCPGEGERGDWRGRTVHCETLLSLFEDIEAELFAEGREPISMSLRRPAREAQLLAQWAGLPIAAGDVEHGDVAHGDHTDHGRPVITHGDSSTR
jgi:uncharacterized protein